MNDAKIGFGKVTILWIVASILICLIQSMQSPHICALFKNFFLVPSVNQTGRGVTTDRSSNQWVDLGILYPDVCLVRPETCTSGGTMAIWIKIRHCDSGDGLVSSVHTASGFQIRCHGGSEIA